VIFYIIYMYIYHIKIIMREKIGLAVLAVIIMMVIFYFNRNIDNPEEAVIAKNAERYEKAKMEFDEYIKKGNYKKAEEVMNEAKKYDFRAYVDIAVLYYDYIDKEQALEKYKEAYENGNTPSSFMVGYIFEKEKKDYKEAEKWYKIATSSDILEAYVLLGNIYKMNGKIDELKKLCEEGANKKFAFMMYRLAGIYFRENNIEEMNYWIERIDKESGLIGFYGNMKTKFEYMKSNNENNKKYIKLILEANEETGYVDSEETKEKLKKAIKYNNDGYLELGHFYNSVEKNFEKAKEAYKIAYEKGVKGSAFALGEIYYETGDYKESEKWYQISVKKENNKNAQFGLARLLSNEGKEEEAHYWYQKSAEQNLAPGMIVMIGYRKNIEEGKMWANKVLTEKGVEDLTPEGKKLAQKFLEINK